MADKESTAKRAVAHGDSVEAQAEKTAGAKAGAPEDRGSGASRGTRPPRGNKARKASRKAEEDLKAGASSDDSSKEEEEEEEEDAASSDREDVFWKHLVWGAYRSRKRRGE